MAGEGFEPIADSNNHDGYGKPGETNSGRSYFEWAMRAAAIFVAIKNTESAYKIAKDQKNIADSYQRSAKQLRDYYNSTYKPYEDQELADVVAMKPYEKNEDTQAGRMSVGALNALQPKFREAIVCAPRYCTGNAAAMLMDLQKDADRILLATKIQGVRIEEETYEMLEERRHSFINKALNRGRDILSSASTFADVSNGVLSRLGGDAARGAGGAMKYLGYSFGRSQREDPIIKIRDPNYDAPTVGPASVGPAPVTQRKPRILG